MYLSRIELHGFKSFADRTILEFSNGLTAIVGPNGSGKTNIVDAIRWVLGEHKASLLRTDGMSQVIFNGTRTRKPVGMAEVSITIENTKKILPAEFSEVVITRRLFRDGESQYLLNGSVCRRKDIVDMFTDTGMGADAYSVIELKMVEQILEDHSDERRHLFEEAAGIVKYKQRRKETLAKLEATKADIERIIDHITEVRRTVGSLKRQAERAERYQSLMDQLRTYELERHRRTYVQYTHQLDTLQTRYQQLDTRHSQIAAHLADTESTIEHINNDIEQLEQQRQSLYEAEHKTATELAAVTQRTAVLQERIASTASSIESLVKDVQHRTTRRDHLEEELERSQTALTHVTRELEQLDIERAELERQLETARTKRAELQSQLDEFNEPLRALERERQRLELLRIQLRRTADHHHQRVQSLNTQLEQINAAIEQLSSQQADCHQTIAALSATLAEFEQQLASATARRAELETRIEQLRLQRDQLSQHSAQLRAQHALLASILDYNELEIQPTEDFPLESLTLLADLITVSDEWAVALESALRGVQQYAVVESRQEVAAVAAWLHRQGRGKAHIICKELIPHIPSPRPIAHSLNSQWLCQVVVCDEPIASFIRGIVEGIATCQSIEEADTLFEHDERITAVVDKHGQIRYRTGLVRVGHTLQTEGLSIGRAQRIRSIEQELEQLENQRTAIEQQIRSAVEERDRLAIDALIEQVRTTERALHEHRRTAEQLSLRATQLQREQHQCQAELNALATELTALAADDAAVDQQLRACDQERTRLDHQQRALSETYRAHQAYVTELEERLGTLAIDTIRQRARGESLQETIARIRAELDALESNQEGTLAEQEQLRFLHTQLESELSAATAEQSAIQAKLDDIQRQRRAVESQLAQYRAALNATHQQITTLRAELEQLTTERHQLHLEQERVRLLCTQLLEQVQSTYNCDLASVEPLFDCSTEELNSTIGKLQSQIAALGAINFSALEQYTEERTRLEELEQQYRDLQASEANLRSTIAEINTTASERFLNTFHAIRGHFKELFALLFQGDGEADLIMEGDDPLEARINIIARPRGKRPLTIEMLSGGEKTLTAIALLFSIYMVKPSPFCILDEVDAPLDDANIDRYLKLIRRFSETTQFLLITHNKRTMEAADVLYGVTMEEPGVSKIVSVRLTDPEPVSSIDNDR